MEVESTPSRWWNAVADHVGRFLDELAFRVLLAARVILGKVPLETEKRYWSRSQEVPVVVNLTSWVDDRPICSTIIWPPLESSKETAASDHWERIQQTKMVLARGAAEMAWSMKLETDFGLRWDQDRCVWTASDGAAFDGILERDATRVKLKLDTLNGRRAATPTEPTEGARYLLTSPPGKPVSKPVP